ncbi:MAG: type II toxin-antitoxin system VapC family toxin [Cryobacterium sp.]|nr:type II toxin-antitoxin system VapC family toxin [Cryobacterium sp.]MBX3310500.1 type II toxin-antitoxin system VapC family toxin [Cryobacterium sp.]
MIALDASVVIAFLSPSDPHHARAAQLLEEHAVAGFRMHQITLAEVLVGAIRTVRGAQLFNDLTTLGVDAHQPGANEPLTLAELRATTGLRMPDCCVLAVAQQESLPLATFDEQLARVAQNLGVETLR